MGLVEVHLLRADVTFRDSVIMSLFMLLSTELDEIVKV